MEDATSPLDSRGDHEQNSSLSYANPLGTLFPLEDGSPRNRTRVPQSVMFQASPNGFSPTEVATNVPPGTGYSQAQLMNKFSIHNSITPAQQQSLSGAVGPDEIDANLGDTNNNDNMMIDTPPDFTQLLSFNTGFLHNESDFISDYLLGSLDDFFPSVDLQPPFVQNMPEAVRMTDGLSLTSSNQNHVSATLPAGLVSNLEQANTPTYVYQKEPDRFLGERDKISGSLDTIDDIVVGNPWAISVMAHERLNMEFMKHIDAIPGTFNLPSRHTLSRYVASFIRGFHPHLPFIHLPTTSLDSMAPVLLLAITTVGSFYGFEHSHGFAMYFVLRAMILEKLEQRHRVSTSTLMQSFPSYAGLRVGDGRGSSVFSNSSVSPQPTIANPIDLELIQALIILIMSMSWLDGPLAEEALAMNSRLCELTREALRSHTSDYPTDWKSWAREEERRRTLFSTFFLFNLLTICFDLPPLLTNSEMKLPLPCSEAEFKAPNAKAWESQRQNRRSCQQIFHYRLEQLLSGESPSSEVPLTEYGNYLLVQGIIQQLYFERQACMLTSSSLSSSRIKVYDTALATWETCWDSSLDATSPQGPLAFNSTAMLRLAHIHLGVGLQNHCSLRQRSPRDLAQAFDPRQNPIPLPSAHLDQAVLHAIHALRVPVRVGIALVARGRTGAWSVQHAITSYACAMLLTHWLDNLHRLVSANGLASLRPEERHLLSIIERLVEETHLEDSLGPKDCYPSRIRRLAVAAVKLWAEICQGIQVYEIVHTVGETLHLVAESLERRLEDDQGTFNDDL